MVYDYVVTLKNQSVNRINIISRLVAGISAAFFLYQQVKSGWHTYLFLASFLLIAGGLSWNWYSAKKHKPVSYSRILLVAGVTWFAMPFLFWIGLPLIAMALLEKQARFHLEIGFTRERIVFNTLIKQKFSWSEFNNILLKDEILTLDFKNNKLIQKETLDDDGDADEEEFNAYCSSRLLEQAGW